LSEFKDVFLEEFPGLPPQRELEFMIELKPRNKTHHKSSLSNDDTIELRELQIQLQELLDLGFIHQVYHCGEHQ
jgi:hypothetical protein